MENVVRIERRATDGHLSLIYHQCHTSAINKKQISRGTKSNSPFFFLLFFFQRLKQQPLKSEEMAALVADVVTTGLIMLLIKYPTSQ